MGRPTKKTEVATTEPTEAIQEQTVANKPASSKANEVEIPANVLEAMRLYPQYEEIWVTPEGFVHPKGAAQYLIQKATLYQNKFYIK